MERSDLRNLTQCELEMLKTELPRLVAQSSPLLASVLRKIADMVKNININPIIKPGDKVKYLVDGITGVVDKVEGELLYVTDEYSVQRVWPSGNISLCDANNTDKADKFKEWSKNVNDLYDVERWSKQPKKDAPINSSIQSVDSADVDEIIWQTYARSVASMLLVEAFKSQEYDMDDDDVLDVLIERMADMAVRFTKKLRSKL